MTHQNARTNGSRPPSGPTKLTEALKGFRGTTRWRGTLSAPLHRRVVHSDGCAYLAEHADAYWLLVAIASHLAVKPTLVRHRILFWRLDRHATGATLYARPESGAEPVVRQPIEWSDFPLPTIDIWTAHERGRWQMFLPSEY